MRSYTTLAFSENMDKLTEGYTQCQSPSSGVISEAFGEWLDNMASWDWYATLTFRDPGEVWQQPVKKRKPVSNPGCKTILPPADLRSKDLTPRKVVYQEQSGILYQGRAIHMVEPLNWSRVGWQYAHKALNNLNSALIGSPPGKNPTWVACMELQKRGVPHWHALFADMGGVRKEDWFEWWDKRYGIDRIDEYDRELGARYYLGKYLSKQVADIRVSPALAVQLRKQTQGELAMVSL